MICTYVLTYVWLRMSLDPEEILGSHPHSFSVKMLAFLSRDPRNAKRVVQIQQDAQASLVVKKAKKCLTEEKKGKTQPTLVFPPVSTEQKPKTNLDVHGILSSFTETTFFQDFLSPISCASHDIPVHSDETILIPAGVRLTMQALLMNIERKFGTKTNKSQLKFLGRQQKPHLTWKQRADIIYFTLHPAFGNGDANLAASVYLIPASTIRTWLRENRYFGRWVLCKESETIPSSKLTATQAWLSMEGCGSRNFCDIPTSRLLTV